MKMAARSWAGETPLSDPFRCGNVCCYEFGKIETKYNPNFWYEESESNTKAYWNSPVLRTLSFNPEGRQSLFLNASIPQVTPPPNIFYTTFPL